MSVHDPSKHHRDANFARNFRRKMMDRKARQGKSGKPMTIFRVRNRFKPSVGGADWVRLIPGSYEGFDGNSVPYYEYIEHFNATVQRGTICSRVYREQPDGELEGSGKCIPCKELEEGATNISFRRMAAFLLLHLDWYYLIPATDDKGNVLTFRRDTKFHKAGDVIMDRVHEAVAFKEYGRGAIKREGYERVFGNLMHWSMGTNHLLVLSAKIDSLESECKCGGEIETMLWECPHCGAEIFDMTPDGESEYTRQEVAQLVTKEVPCKSCGKRGMLVPVRECTKCKNPTPLQLWDVDLCVGREGEQTQSQLIVHKHKHVPIDERCKDLVPERDILQRVFAGDSIEYQSKSMRIPNPWHTEDARRHVEDYGNSGKEDQADESEAEDGDLPF
jgi:hypothetical protein